MQPAGQSPQPTYTVTMKAPTPDAGMTSYQADWPMRSGSLSWMFAKRGSVAATAAHACSGVVTGPPAGADAPALSGASGEPVADSEGAADAPPPEPEQAASMSAASS